MITLAILGKLLFCFWHLSYFSLLVSGMFPHQAITPFRWIFHSIPSTKTEFIPAIPVWYIVYYTSQTFFSNSIFHMEIGSIRDNPHWFMLSILWHDRCFHLSVDFWQVTLFLPSQLHSHFSHLTICNKITKHVVWPSHYMHFLMIVN